MVVLWYSTEPGDFLILKNTKTFQQYTSYTFNNIRTS